MKNRVRALVFTLLSLVSLTASAGSIHGGGNPPAASTSGTAKVSVSSLSIHGGGNPTGAPPASAVSVLSIHGGGNPTGNPPPAVAPQKR